MRSFFTLLAPLAACSAPSPEPEEKEVAAPAPAPRPAVPSPPPAPPHTSPWSATGYALNGAAPVWGGSLTGTTVRYMTPDDQFGDVIETRLALSPDAFPASTAA